MGRSTVPAVGVRCPACRAEVSEWAGWCPQCHGSLADAELVDAERVDAERVDTELVDTELVGDLAPGDSGRIDQPSTPTTPRRPAATVRFGVVGAVLVAVGLIAAVVLRPGSVGNHSPAGSIGGLPAALAAEHLFFAEPARTGVYRADGSLVSNFQTRSGEGAVPVVSGEGEVVYVHAGEAYRISRPGSPGATPVAVGPAESVFPALGGAVGIESGQIGGVQYVEYMAAGGTFPTPGTRRLELPPGTTAVAQIPDGLLTTTTSYLQYQIGQSPVLGLSRMEVHSTRSLGTASAVIDVHANAAALVTCRLDRPADCALRLVDAASGQTRVVAVPPGFAGYAEGGAFSPDGKRLAAFVSTEDRYGGTVLHLAMVRTDTATVAVIGPPLVVGTPAGTAVWSPDGRWLYFGAEVDGTLYATATATATGRVWTLPLPTSTAVAGLR